MRRRQPLASEARNSANNTTAQPATASAPSAAVRACRRSITNGSKIIHAASAIAICAVTAITCGPCNRRESITGSASAADDEAMRTAYIAAWPVPKPAASPAPSPTATAPPSAARASACGSDERSAPARTGTWVPTTNMTNAKPMLASSWNVGLVTSTTPRPVRPTTRPAISSPMITGIRRRGSAASSGPASPMAVSSARVWKPNPGTSAVPARQHEVILHCSRRSSRD